MYHFIKQHRYLSRDEEIYVKRFKEIVNRDLMRPGDFFTKSERVTLIKTRNHPLSVRLIGR